MCDARLEILDQIRDAGEIDEVVYDAVSLVLSNIDVDFLPGLSIFSHGPQSIVLNWVNGARNLYFTVGKSQLSVLISSRDAIEFSDTYPLVDSPRIWNKLDILLDDLFDA